MLKIACMKFATTSGVKYFRAMQPLMYLNKFFPDKVKVVFGNDKNIMDITAGCDIYFHSSPGFRLMRTFAELVKENVPDVKLVYDFDDAPDKFITPDIPAYRDFGTEEDNHFYGSVIGRNGRPIDFKRTWKNNMIVDGLPFHAGKNIGRVIDCQVVKEQADYITTTTEYLSGELKKIVKAPVKILPNFIEPALYEPVKDKDKGENEVRIGWVLGHSHLTDLIDLLPCLIDLLNENRNVKLFIMSQYNDMLINLVKQIDVPADRFIIFPSVGITEGYFNAVRHLDLDIALLHLKNNSVFNKCKSPLKFLEMTAIGAAVIAPDILYSDYIKNEISGLIYSNKIEFNSLIRKLIKDAGLRKSLNAEARKVIEPYTAREIVPKYLEFFESIMVAK